MQVNRPYGFDQGGTISDNPTVDIVTPTSQSPDRGYHLTWGLFNHSLEEGNMILPGVYELTSLQITEVGESIYSFGAILQSNEYKVYMSNLHANGNTPLTIDGYDSLSFRTYITNQPSGVNISQHVVATAKNPSTQENVQLTRSIIDGWNDEHWVRFSSEDVTAPLYVTFKIDVESTTPSNVFDTEIENNANTNFMVDINWV